MKKIKRNLKKIRDSNEGAVGVVVTILLIVLIFSVITMVQTVYVPIWTEQKEAEHMEDVANQFSMLKFAIDTQSLIQKDNPISTSITLGNREMPFLSSSRSFGSLDVLNNEFSLTVQNGTDNFSYYSFGIIKFSSNNAYFLDQSYIYEGGAVIMDQLQGNIMTIQPSLKSEIINNEEINLTLNIINVSGIEGKTSVSGYGTYPIKTIFSKSRSPIVITEVDNLNISTDYPNAWEIFFNKTLSESNDLSYGVHFSITEHENGVTIEFTDVNPTNLHIKIVDIDVQIGSGWI